MAATHFIVYAAAMTAGALVLVFLALLVLYRRLKGSFRNRTAELADISARLAVEMDTRTRIDRDLAESESRFRQMVASLPIGILISDVNGHLTYANTAAAQMLRTSSERIIGSHYAPTGAQWEVIEPNGTPLRPEDNPFTQVIEARQPYPNTEHVIRWSSGYSVHLSINAAPLLSTRGELVGVIAALEDVSDLARTRKELVTQKRFFEQMFLQSSLATQIFDRSGNRVRANSEWCRLFDVEDEQLSRQPYNIFEDRAIIRAGMTAGLHRVVDDRITAEWEVLLEINGPPEPKMRWFRIRAYPIWDEGGQTTNLIVHYEDVTERRQTEDRMSKSLREKELLLKEVHHRVKNNMQLMKSMLNLQAGYIRDPQTLSMFTDSASRINTMALIHEKLYRSERFGSIDIRVYLTYIADNLRQTYSNEDRLVDFELDLRAAVVDIDTAVPCGLLANELISNAMKHAFAGRSKGTILLAFREVPVNSSDGQRGPGTRYELIVEDDGCGMSREVDWTHSDSLGLKLVNSLVQQLDGEIALESTPGSGTRISVQFSRREGTEGATIGVTEA